MLKIANERTADTADASIADEEATASAACEVIRSDSLSPAQSNRRIGYRFLKRTFDILASLMGLMILSPLFLIISAVIFFSEGGRPIFHRRRCVGKNGYYDMLKFRTMVKDADSLEKYLNEEQMKIYMRDCKLDSDPRITKVGKFLRKTSLDELPQLVNVLKAEMSIVGPRPVVEWEAAEYGKDREKLLSCRPGITGYWQVYGREINSYDNGERMSMQLYYIDHQSTWMDITLIFKTVMMVLSGRGAK